MNNDERDYASYYDYIHRTISNQDNWVKSLDALKQLKLISDTNESELSLNNEYSSEVANLLLEYMENQTYYSMYDNDLSVLGVARELLALTEVNVKYTDIANPIELNPLPELCYFVDKFSPEKLYLDYQGNIYQFNTTYLSSISRDNNLAVWLANYLLESVGSNQRVYFLYNPAGNDMKFFVALDRTVYAELSQKLELPFIENNSDFDINDYEPIDLKEQIKMVSPIFDNLLSQKSYKTELKSNSSFAIPNTQSMTSRQAREWLDSQVANIKSLYKTDELPKSFESLSNSNSIEKLGEIFNVFIAITRQLIADSRVIDQLYRRYPLLKNEQFKKLVLLLKTDASSNESDTDLLMTFLFSEKTLNALINHIYDNERQNELLNQVIS